MNIKLQNKNEYIFSMVTKVFVVLISLAQQVLIARFLGAGVKGEVSYIQNLVGIISIIAAMGLHHSYPVYRKNEKYSEDNKNYFISGVIILIASYFIIAFFVILLFDISISLKMAFLISPLIGYGNIIGYVYLIENPNRRNADILLFSVIDIILYALVIVTCESNIITGLLLLYLIEFVKCFYFTFALKAKIIINHDVMLILKQQLIIGFFPMLSLLLTNLNYKLDILMLSNSRNVTVVDVGIYSVAIAIAEKALLLPDALKEILISKLSKGSSYKEVMKINRIAIMLSLLTSICISTFCGPVVRVLFGKEYLPAIGLIRITTFGTAFMVIFKTVGSYNIVNNRQRINLLFLTISVVFNFACNAIFIPMYGTYGAAYATIIGFLVCGVLFSCFFCKTENVSLKRFLFVNSSDIDNIKSVLFKEHKRG